MGSHGWSWRRMCPSCQARRIDPLGCDDEDVGQWCGQCDVDWQLARAKIKVSKLLSHRPLIPCLPAIEVMSGFLGGTRKWYKLALRRCLLRLILEGKAYGFRPTISKLFSGCFNNRTDWNSDVLDRILDGVQLDQHT